MLYKEEENNLQTTLYRKPTDQKFYLCAKSEHPSKLKNIIAYSQTLRLRSTEDKHQSNCAVMT